MVADTLSRPAAAAAGAARVCAAIADRSPLDLKDMALRQNLCPQIQTLRSSPGLRIITRRSATSTSLATHPPEIFRPLVPRDLWQQVFEHLHGTAHPGRRVPRRLISSRYVWKGLSTDVTAWAKACLGCQRAKVHRHVQVPPQHIPAVLTSDRGAQFTSSLWAALCSLLNIQHNQTTAYHPQSNGMVERFHRRLKDALRTRCAAANWVGHLLGPSWASAQQPGKTTAPPPLRQCSAHHSFYLANFKIL